MELNESDKLLNLLRDKYKWKTEYLTEADLQVIEDVSNATMEIYHQEQLNKMLFPKAETMEAKVQYSLFRITHLFKAAMIDKKFLLDYGKWDKNSKIEEAMRKSFPLLGKFIKLVDDRILNSPNITEFQKEMHEEICYLLLECHEKLTQQIGLEPKKQP